TAGDDGAGGLVVGDRELQVRKTRDLAGLLHRRDQILRRVSAVHRAVLNNVDAGARLDRGDGEERFFAAGAKSADAVDEDLVDAAGRVVNLDCRQLSGRHVLLVVGRLDRELHGAARITE